MHAAYTCVDNVNKKTGKVGEPTINNSSTKFIDVSGLECG
jgi:hypothetical protein